MAAPRCDRPNIVLFMSDEHTAAITGCYGNGLVRTPNLDRLAADGVTFDAAYTNSPLCVPARLAFTAGKYISRCGAWSNNCRLPSDEMPSLPRVLQAAGYETFLCGKMHYDKTRRYGFTELGNPEINHNHFTKTGRGRRRDADDASINTDSRDRRFARFHPGRTSPILRHDRHVTRTARDFLRHRRRSDRPFFLLVGHVAPHFPLIVPNSYWERYRGRIPMPVLPEGHVAAQPLNYQHLRRGFGVVQTDPQVVRRGRELYYGFVEWLDNEIGKVLGTLAGSPVADDTIVIYTTDHGEDLGEHGLWWKNCMYDCAAQVPLVMRHPARWSGAQRRAGACSHLDLVQTLAELAGAETPGDWDGDSMCRWLDDPDSDWKDRAVSEYYAHNIASGFAMIREGRMKYVYHTPPDAERPAERELYDLVKDPGEFVNLAARPEHRERIAQLHRSLVAELGQDPDETERICRADYAGGYPDAP
jgi:choline-sulfatase